MPSRNNLRKIRARRVSAKIAPGLGSNPKISVFKSLRHLEAQVIDIKTQKSLGTASTKSKDCTQLNNDQKIEFVAQKIAQILSKKKITKAVFDRNGYPYHGKIKNLADAIRAKGITL